MQGAPPLRTEEVPNDAICSICFGIPLKPMLTPCEHIFCEGCADQAWQISPSCPNCRNQCERGQLRPIPHGTFIYRVWSAIAVKCPMHEQGCAWSGSIVDFSAHVERCQHRQENKSNNITDTTADSNQEVARLQRHILELNENLRQKEEQLQTLEDDDRLSLPVLFTDDYYFKRETVVELSQLIARYVDCKPSHIDSNRIYNCIRLCYLDLENDYTDNPPHYYEDMRMLLSTCAATTASWFSEKQRANIRSWIARQGWD